MADRAGTTGTGTMRSDLIDLSGVALDELREVDGLPEALDALRSRLADGSSPLCQGEMTAPCGSAPWARSGSRP
ncbi:hypothetical protein [Streptomyces telluris]|uniref:FXSXX-COOH protein n=1 Tax=Streptomyces telluris TaxID=2720021 RepID=A0A9X2LGW8_9ACTN|nr:hypothetical protein [Streptomyces telluris]MCQ8770933.1 hypothetical protein [Streptomyces telluris]NJP82448.1 hypothetical protein [Streptomyces telluris]